jgi:hypothetical protein
VLKRRPAGADARKVSPQQKVRLGVICLIGVAAIVCTAIAVTAAKGPGDAKVLEGITGQGARLTAHLEGDGRMDALKTSLEARCSDGGTWKSRWSPAEGGPRVRFRHTGDRVTVSQAGDLSYPDGTTGRVSIALQGWASRDGRAVSGKMRMVARVRRRGRRTAVCDTRELRWAAGRGAPRLVARP